MDIERVHPTSPPSNDMMMLMHQKLLNSSSDSFTSMPSVIYNVWTNRFHSFRISNSWRTNIYGHHYYQNLFRTYDVSDWFSDSMTDLILDWRFINNSPNLFDSPPLVSQFFLAPFRPFAPHANSFEIHQSYTIQAHAPSNTSYLTLETAHCVIYSSSLQ